MYRELGVCPKLKLTGRPIRPVGSLGTSKVNTEENREEHCSRYGNRKHSGEIGMSLNKNANTCDRKLCETLESVHLTCFCTISRNAFSLIIRNIIFKTFESKVLSNSYMFCRYTECAE